MSPRDKTERQKYLIALANDLMSRWWHDVPKKAGKELIRLSAVEAQLHAAQLEVELLKRRLVVEAERTDRWSRRALHFASLVEAQIEPVKPTPIDTGSSSSTPASGSVEAQLKVITQRLGRVESVLRAYKGVSKPGEST